MYAGRKRERERGAQGEREDVQTDAGKRDPRRQRRDQGETSKSERDEKKGRKAEKIDPDKVQKKQEEKTKEKSLRSRAVRLYHRRGVSKTDRQTRQKDSLFL